MDVVISDVVIAGAGSDRVAGALSYCVDDDSAPVRADDGFDPSADRFGPTVSGGGAGGTPHRPANIPPARTGSAAASPVSLRRDSRLTAGFAGHETFSFVTLVAAMPGFSVRSRSARPPRGPITRRSKTSH
ncbi:hypothetical protein [Rhodopila sp.]|uniref:hypothetical protein n=1 Tax=Rhodopila sp. TaxID=2480087 RepID=UPI003D0A6B49